MHETAPAVDDVRFFTRILRRYSSTARGGGGYLDPREVDPSLELERQSTTAWEAFAAVVPQRANLQGRWSDCMKVRQGLPERPFKALWPCRKRTGGFEHRVRV